MGNQIIKQPDGNYAVWSSVVDAFVLIDATPEEIIEELTEEKRARITKDVYSIIEALDEGAKPYYQFTLSWQDAIGRYESVHHKKFDLEELRRESV